MSAAMSLDNLGSSVLVLNRHFIAVHIVNVKRAFCLLFRELAEVIELEDGRYTNYDFNSWRELSELKSQFKEPDDDWVRAINFEIQAPRIIRLFSYDRVPRQTVRFNRRNIFARDSNRCQYCGHKFPTTELSLDHIVPRTQGGAASWENIVCCCIDCNVRKGGRTPEQAGVKLIRKPIKPKRNPMLTIKLGNPKYRSWKTFLDSAYWNVDLR